MHRSCGSRFWFGLCRGIFWRSGWALISILVRNLLVFFVFKGRPGTSCTANGGGGGFVSYFCFCHGGIMTSQQAESRNPSTYPTVRWFSLEGRGSSRGEKSGKKTC